MKSRVCMHRIETYPLHKSSTHRWSASHLWDLQEKGGAGSTKEKETKWGNLHSEKGYFTRTTWGYDNDNTVSELVGINNSYTTVLSWKYHVKFHVVQHQT